MFDSDDGEYSIEDDFDFPGLIFAAAHIGRLDVVRALHRRAVVDARAVHMHGGVGVVRGRAHAQNPERGAIAVIVLTHPDVAHILRPYVYSLGKLTGH